MKYVILIHSNPQPWGHPTSEFLPQYESLSDEERRRQGEEFDALLQDLSERGELVGGQALGDPRDARLFRWEGGRRKVTDGPYAETAEHFAGFFLIDVASQDRAEEVTARFSGPGETVELRPLFA
ncbi:YciI family protein [Phycicoccus sp. M110.8]|uniref:YciI family protein n=1 Tax=Phycicoccus sp. M110.8 TaxID=3075433 RepID=UPI0028FD4BFF|nr:YciI family protein [Phycicoccus sp. M110.8]MDU0314816.1 YciI family protein [Phycicoccus sp. M110.8]